MQERPDDEQPQFGQQPQSYPQQPYGQQPYVQQPQFGQPTPPKKGKKVAKGCGIGCGGVVGLVIIIGVVAAVAGGNKSNNSNTAASAPTTASAPVTKQAPATTAPATTKAAPTTKVVLKVSGSGIKNTASFTTGDDWSIKYSFNCANFGGQGNFVVTVYDGDTMGDLPVNELAAKGSDVTYEHGDSGSHYLSINSECSWTVTVTDGE